MKKQHEETKRFNRMRRYYLNKVKYQACRDYETQDQIEEVVSCKALANLCDAAETALLFGDVPCEIKWIIERYYNTDETAETTGAKILMHYLDNDVDYNRDMYAYRNGVWYNGRAEWYEDIEINED